MAGRSIRASVRISREQRGQFQLARWFMSILVHNINEKEKKKIKISHGSRERTMRCSDIRIARVFRWAKKRAVYIGFNLYWI